MELVNPNQIIELKVTVSIPPASLDNDIFISLNRRLKDMVEGKCFGEYGYIQRVINILNYSQNTIPIEDLGANCLFDVDFTAKICLPIMNERVVCYIKNLSQDLIRCVGGPFDIFITKDNINSMKFIRNNRMELMNKETNELVNENEFVIISIIEYLIINGERKITVRGFLEEMATEDDIYKYYDNEYNTEV